MNHNHCDYDTLLSLNMQGTPVSESEVDLVVACLRALPKERA